MIKFMVYVISSFAIRALCLIPMLAIALLICAGSLLVFIYEIMAEPFIFAFSHFRNKIIWTKFWQNTSWKAVKGMIKRSFTELWKFDFR